MATLIKVIRDKQGRETPIPMWIPDRYAMERHLERLTTWVLEMAKAERESEEEREKHLRDTKPEFIVNNSVPGRVVIAVGAGEEWREDLKDIARRTLEKPDPRKNPALTKRHRMKNDIDTYAWLAKRLPTQKKSFHIALKPGG